MAPTCQLCVSLAGRFRKGTMASACHSVWEKTVPQLLPWCQTLQFLPVCRCCISSYPGTGAQREWVWVSSHVGSLRGTPHRLLGILEVSSIDSIPTALATRIYGDLSFWHWKPVLWNLIWGCDSLLPRYPTQIFSHHTWIWDQPFPHLCPSYQSGWMWFLLFCSCQTSIQLDFWWFWVMVVLYFSYNFDVAV